MNRTLNDTIQEATNAALQGDEEARQTLKDAADTVRREEARETVEGCAEAVKDQLREEPERPPHEVLTETCDGMVIGYHEAREYLKHSDHADTWREVSTDPDAIGVEARAVYALERDVYEHLRQGGEHLPDMAQRIRQEGAPA